MRATMKRVDQSLLKRDVDASCANTYFAMDA